MWLSATNWQLKLGSNYAAGFTCCLPVVVIVVVVGRLNKFSICKRACFEYCQRQTIKASEVGPGQLCGHVAVANHPNPNPTQLQAKWGTRACAFCTNMEVAGGQPQLWQTFFHYAPDRPVEQYCLCYGPVPGSIQFKYLVATDTQLCGQLLLLPIHLPHSIYCQIVDTRRFAHLHERI